MSCPHCADAEARTHALRAECADLSEQNAALREELADAHEVMAEWQRVYAALLRGVAPEIAG